MLQVFLREPVAEWQHEAAILRSLQESAAAAQAAAAARQRRKGQERQEGAEAEVEDSSSGSSSGSSGGLVLTDDAGTNSSEAPAAELARARVSTVVLSLEETRPPHTSGVHYFLGSSRGI